MTKNLINTSELKLKEDVLYINSNIQSGLTAKIAVLAINLLVFFTIGFLSTMDAWLTLTSQALLIMACIGLYASIVFPWTLWNFAGKERIMISSKSIMWEHDYGIYVKKSQAVKHDKLEIKYEQCGTYNNSPLVQIIFTSLNQHKFRDILYKSNIRMSLFEAENISMRLNELYYTTQHQKLELPEYVLN